MNTERIKIRLAGSGGQGIILAAIVLAEAAGIHDDRYVCQTQSYGPEARGGSCKAEVVISNSEIDYPKAKNLDILLALNQESLDDYFHDLKSDGTLIVNSDMCIQVPISSAYQVPMNTVVIEKVGIAQTMNMMALGALAAITGVVTPASLKKAVKERAPCGTAEKNLLAVEVGMKEGKSALLRHNKKPTDRFSSLLVEE